MNGDITFTAEGVQAYSRDEFIRLHPTLMDAGAIWDKYNPKPKQQPEKPKEATKKEPDGK